MTKQVQRRRGTATQHTSFTGAEGEISVNTTNKSVHVHDGTTAGGIEAARADMTNVTDANLNARLNGNTLSSLTITSADINGGTIDGTVIGGTTAAAGTFSAATVNGNIIVTGTVDGRDIAADGTKLDGIESGADVTDTTNVASALASLGYDTGLATMSVPASTTISAFGATLIDDADAATARTTLGLGTAATTASTDYATAAQGALADSAVQPNDSPTFGSITVTGTVDGRDIAADGTKLDGIEAGATADQTAAEIKTAYESNADTNAFTDAEQSKLSGIEAGADVTDTANVTAAGALMDSELTNITAVKALDQGVATTDSPSFAGLTVDTADNIVAAFNSTDAAAAIEITEPTHTYRMLLDNGLMRYQSDPSNNQAGSLGHAFEVDLSEKMRITGGGNVGIGTVSPTKVLHITSDASDHIALERSGIGTYTIDVVSGDALRISDDGTERFRIASSGNVGIGTASPSYTLDVKGTTDPSIRVASTGTASTDDAIIRAEIGGTTANSYLMFGDSSDTNVGEIRYNHTSDYMAFTTNAAEAMRIDSVGNVLVGTSSGASVLTTTSTESGAGFSPTGYGVFTGNGKIPLYINRLTNDGALVAFRQAGTAEGNISVSGTTVSYNGGHLSRWSRLPDGTDDSNILKGTVMTNLNEKVVWDGEDNEQLNHTTVSSTEGDKDVAGVFVAWDDSDDWGDYYLAMTGDMIIRIAAGTTVERGDLLMSAGDGTAKPQGDGIVRSKTIAKVISTETTCTYADGSYCVPCVLMAC